MNPFSLLRGRRGGCVLAILLWGTALEAATPVYLEPVETQPIAQLSDDDPLLGQAVPVADPALAARQWVRVDRPGSYRGFVEISQIGKDLQVREGAPVHLRPEATSPVLMVMGATDRADILWTGDWWEIQVEKSLPVYFRRPEASVSAAPVAMTTAPVVVAAAPVTVAPVPLPPAPPPAAPVAAPVAVVPPPPVPAGVPQPLRTVTQPADVADGLSLHFEGVLRPSKAGLFRPAPFPYEMANQEGERVAYVDLDTAIIPGAVPDYLNRVVVIFGEKAPVEGSRDIVIKARNLWTK